MTTVILVVAGAFFAIAAVVLAFAWMICVGSGMPRNAGRGALVAAGILLVLAVLSIGSAFAQDHHPLHRDFYRHWREPLNPERSCCDARVTKDGVETGDCEPTKAEMRKGDWYVWIRQLERFERVTDDVVVYERNPNGQDAHICWTPGRGIICFVPPDTGG